MNENPYTFTPTDVATIEAIPTASPPVRVPTGVDRLSNTGMDPSHFVLLALLVLLGGLALIKGARHEHR